MFLLVFFHSPFSSNAEKSFNLLKENENSVISNNLDSFNLASPNKQDSIQFNQETKIEIKENSIPIDNYLITPQSDYLVHDDRFIFNSSLTENDPDDMFFFQIPNDRSIAFEIDSNNSNYKALLYYVDFEGGIAYETDVIADVNNRGFGNIFEGTWAIRVFSEEDLGNDYTIKMNAIYPYGAINVYSTSKSLYYTSVYYPNGDVLLNGDYIFNLISDNEHLSWERKFYFGWDGNYNRRNHKISSVKVSSVSNPVSYQSSYASSNNAVLVYLNQDTLFT